MPQPGEIPELAAFFAAVSDVLAQYFYEGRAVVVALEEKGILTRAEYERTKATIPHAELDKLRERIQSQLMTRSAQWYSKLSGGSGNLQ